MKPTDEERREVAENLRNMCGCGCRYAEEFYELLNETVMRAWDFHDFHDVANRLADLIEPEERTCRNLSGGSAFHCGSCGYHIDSCIDDCLCGLYAWDIQFCPNCGAKVVPQ